MTKPFFPPINPFNLITLNRESTSIVHHRPPSPFINNSFPANTAAPPLAAPSLPNSSVSLTSRPNILKPVIQPLTVVTLTAAPSVEHATAVLLTNLTLPPHTTNSHSRIWRRWHRKINVNQKRYAVVSAIAASAVPSLVLARGHRIEAVPEFPLVVGDFAKGVEKVEEAIKVLKRIRAFPDAEKAKDSHGIRPGKGMQKDVAVLEIGL
ncbi:hypothetical protein KIW84_062962 [Lathyrus oleraceus]|uniref:Uncharacterized protein n=1 Tax=Pisum sativum TaxID=3888 RepID=A0A9D5A475_PEA|nr:hypothetical protein KIW84_062962 [Pisum sativum]